MLNFIFFFSKEQLCSQMGGKKKKKKTSDRKANEPSAATRDKALKNKSKGPVMIRLNVGMSIQGKIT